MFTLTDCDVIHVYCIPHSNHEENYTNKYTIKKQKYNFIKSSCNPWEVEKRETEETNRSK